MTYTRVQAENLGNHQRFDPTLLAKKLWPFSIRMQQKKILILKKKIQIRQFSNFFRENFMDWSLG